MLKPTQKPRGRRFSPGRSRSLKLKFQAGFTMIEAMIALSLSVVVIGSMVALMSNSLGTTTRIIEMSQLTDELRNSMSMMSRDIRRANYNANNLYCYGNSDCGVPKSCGGTDLPDASARQGCDDDGGITINNTNDCFTFQLDRGWDGDATNDDAGGFRLETVIIDGESFGQIVIWVGDSSPLCTAPVDDNDNWVPVTDPDFVDITTFTVNDDESFTLTASGSGGTTISQTSREIKMILEGELIRDASITRRIENSIRVRNDIFL